MFCDALHEAFAKGREPGRAELVGSITRTVPLAQLMDGQIAALRHWARGRAREAGANGNPSKPCRHGRKVEAGENN